MIQTKYQDKLKRVTVGDDGTIYVDGKAAALRTNTGTGYNQFNVDRATFRAHRVIAWSLFGDAMDQRFPRVAAVLGDGVVWDVAHKNRNRTDNRPENLMWCPRSFNAKHSILCPVVSRIIGYSPELIAKRRAAGRKWWAMLTEQQKQEQRAEGRKWWAMLTEQQKQEHRDQSVQLMKEQRATIEKKPLTKEDRARIARASWATASDERRDRLRNRNRARADFANVRRGTAHPFAKLTLEIAARLREWRATGRSVRQLARELGISKTHAHRVSRGEGWQ